MAFFPLPKQYNPDFAIPGKKPATAAGIDWSNPITRGLKVCFDGNRDYIGHKKVNQINAASSSSKYDQHGKYLESTSTSDGGVYYDDGPMSEFAGQPFALTQMNARLRQRQLSWH